MIKSARSRFDCEANRLPPSSSGLGRSPFKATTGVRIPVGASISRKPPADDVERFLSMLRPDSKEKVNALGLDTDLKTTETPN